MINLYAQNNSCKLLKQYFFWTKRVKLITTMLVNFKAFIRGLAI